MLGFTVPTYASEGSDKPRTAVRLLYKERRVQVFYIYQHLQGAGRHRAALGGQTSLGVLRAYRGHIRRGCLSAGGGGEEGGGGTGP